jgi:hypothetical protein
MRRSGVRFVVAAPEVSAGDANVPDWVGGDRAVAAIEGDAITINGSVLGTIPWSHKQV